MGLPEASPLRCDVELLSLLLACCVLPEDTVEPVPLPFAPLPLLALSVLLLLFALLDAWVFDCEAACALEEDDCASVEGAGAGDGAAACGGTLCAAVLALCAASFCESMLCCKVWPNGCALAVLSGELVGKLLEASNSELIGESGDMADPVYPVNPVGTGDAVMRSGAQAPAGAGHAVMQARGLCTLSAHPESSCCVFIGVALFAPCRLLGFRCVAACLQYFVRA